MQWIAITAGMDSQLRPDGAQPVADPTPRKGNPPALAAGRISRNAPIAHDRDWLRHNPPDTRLGDRSLHRRLVQGIPAEMRICH